MLVGGGGYTYSTNLSSYLAHTLQYWANVCPTLRQYLDYTTRVINFSPNLALFQHVSHMQQRMFSQSSNEGMYVLASVECKRSESPQLLKVDDPRCVHILSTRGHKIHQRRGGPYEVSAFRV